MSINFRGFREKDSYYRTKIISKQYVLSCTSFNVMNELEDLNVSFQKNHSWYASCI